MRTTKQSQYTMAYNQRKRLERAFERTGGKPVEIYYPDATEYELDILRQHYKVERRWLGYIRFELKDESRPLPVICGAAEI